jgi:hypothetical protein
MLAIKSGDTVAHIGASSGSFWLAHRSARDTRQDALLSRETQRVLEGFFVRHLFDLIDQRKIPDLRNEAGANSLDSMAGGVERLTGPLLSQDWACCRLDRYRDDRLALRVLDIARNPGDGSACADSRN